MTFQNRKYESAIRCCRAVFVFCFSFSLSIAVFAAPGDEAYQLYLKGLLHERFGEPQDAWKQYERVVALDPRAAFVHEAMASLAMRLGQMDRALQEAEEVVRLDPKSPHSYLVLGRVRLARAEMDEASNAFDRALEADPNDNEALLYAAHIRVPSRSEEALTLYDRFLQNNPNSVEVRGRMAEIYQRLGNTDAATEAWKEVLKIDPGDFSANLALAHIYEVKGDTTSAIQAYEACRFLNPENINVLARLGEMHYRFGNLTLAEETFRQALARAPQDPTLNFWIALLLEERKDWEGALRHMDVSARSGPEPGVMLRMAYYHSQLDQDRKALRILRKLQKQFPDNPDFLFYVAMAYEDLGKPRAAVRWLEKTLLKDPKRVEAHFHLGTNWDALKRFDRAEKYLLQAIDLDPRHAVALNYLGYSWVDRGLNLDQALLLIQRALLEEPDNGAYLDSLGWAYFKLNRLPEASATLERAVQKIQDPLVWEHYGDILSKMGKTEDAVRAWQEGLVLGPERPTLVKKLKGHDRYLLPKTEPRRVLKGIEGNFRQLQNLAGSMQIDGKLVGRSFHGRGIFYYSKPQLFRLEFLGPFFVPQGLLLKNPAGVHWLPPELAQNSLNAEEAWLNVLGDFLSGEVVRRFDDPLVTVKKNGQKIVYSADFGEITVNEKDRVVTNLSWNLDAGKNGLLKIRFRHYKEIEGLRIPSRIECSFPQGELTLLFTPRRLRINTVLDAGLFRLPVSSTK